jgi:hypothetical protein
MNRADHAFEHAPALSKYAIAAEDAITSCHRGGLESFTANQSSEREVEFARASQIGSAPCKAFCWRQSVLLAATWTVKLNRRRA